MELIEVSNVDESDPIWGQAINLSRKSLMKFKHGSIILKRGKIIGFGYNKNKSHPKYGSKKDYMTLHSEGDAIWCAKKLGNDTRGATIIVYRRGCRNSKPCESCQKLIKKAGIVKVIYTNHEERNSAN